MPLLRAALMLVVFLAPPTAVALFAHYLYDLGWLMSVVVFLVAFFAWGEGVRALRRLD